MGVNAEALYYKSCFPLSEELSSIGFVVRLVCCWIEFLMHEVHHNRNRQQIDAEKNSTHPGIGENEFELVSEQCSVAFAEIQLAAACDNID